MNEVEIRKRLIAVLSDSHEGRAAEFIAEMFFAGFSRRADLIMVNGNLSVFEIKSERDTLDRLVGQIESYVKFFENVTVVCSSKHIENATKLVPETVGIWEVKNNGLIRVERMAKTQSFKSAVNLISFLPVDEIKLFLRENNLSAVGNREALVQKADLISILEIKNYVLAFLKRRKIRIQNIIEMQRRKT